MLTHLQTRLDRLRNRPTLYELAMIRGDDRILIAYSRRGRNNIYKSVTKTARALKIVNIAGVTDIHFDKIADKGAQIGLWDIVFTGRTQRDAFIQGELPYIEDVDPALYSLTASPATLSTTQTNDPT